MCPDLRLRTQQGAGLPIALFIITVLALLVVGMAQLQQSASDSVSLQIQSQRAFYAAESGAQLAVRNVLDGNSCGVLVSPVNFSAAGLAGCSAELSCESIPATIGGSGGDIVFTINSIGQCGAGADRAVREVEVRVR